MTEWATVNIPEKLKQKIEKEKVENGSFSSAADYVKYATRKGLEEELNIEEKIKELVKEDCLKDRS